MIEFLERLGKRKWIAFTLIAVILPISLLTTLKLTGVIPESQTPETITMETINWEMERLTYTVEIGEKIKNNYTADKTAIEMGVQIHAYREEASSSPFFGNDGISFSVFVNITQGHILSSMIKYYPLDLNTTVLIDISDWALVLCNATVTEMNIVGTNSSEAYVAIKVPNSPCRIESLAHWIFSDKKVETHQLHIEVEVTYFNGSIYKKIVTPIHLKVWVSEAMYLSLLSEGF